MKRWEKWNAAVSMVSSCCSTRATIFRRICTMRKPGTWDARVDLLFTTSEALAFTMVWPRRGRGPSGREQRRIRSLVVQHREELLDEWDRKVFRQ